MFHLKVKNMRYITGCISCMPLIVTVNTIAECPRTDCDIYWGGGGGGVCHTDGNASCKGYCIRYSSVE
jgi:hypothetical protein